MSVLATLEAACLALHAPPTTADAELKRSNAQVTLEHFKNSPSALEDATQLVAISTTPPIVQFFCIATIREITLKKWPQLSTEEKSKPMDLMMQVLWERYTELPPFVASSMLQSIVLMIKRGWIERSLDERQVIIQQMGQMMINNANAVDTTEAVMIQRLIAAKWMLAFITEFSSASRSSVMFQPVEFHTETRRMLREGGLKDIVQYAIQLLEYSIESTTKCSTQTGTVLQVPPKQLELLETAFHLVIEILNWDFTDSMGTLAWSKTTTDIDDESRPSILPDKSWRPILVRPELIHSAFNTYSFFRNLQAVRHKDTLLHLARQYIIQLSSLCGSIFASKSERLQFLNEIFNGVSVIIHSPFLEMVAIQDENAYESATRELIDMCQVLFRIVNNAGLEAMIKNAPSSLLASFLHQLSALSCKLLQSGLDTIRNRTQYSDEASLWQLEGVGVLLDAWVALINDSYLEAGAFRTPDESQQIKEVVTILSQACKPVVEMYLQLRLELCAVTALEDQDEEEDVDDETCTVSSREQAELVAVLARMNISTASLLLNLLQSLLQDVQQCLNTLTRDEMGLPLAQLYEKVHFTVEFVGLFLANDVNTSERAVPPPHILMAFDNSSTATDVTQLLLLILSHVLEIDASRVAANPDSATLSPYVTEQLLRTITRLCVTYIADPDESSKGTELPVSLTATLQQAIPFVIQKCSLYIVHWPTQPMVMNNLVELFLALSKLESVRHVLETSFWQSLLRATSQAGTVFSSQPRSSVSMQLDPLEVAMARLPSPLRGQLVEALCRSGMMSEDASKRTAHFELLAGPISTRLQRVMATPNLHFSQCINDVGIQQELMLILELVSGIARSAEKQSYRIVASFCLPLLPIMVQLSHVFHVESAIVYLILRFFCVMVEAQLCYLPANEALHVFKTSNELIRTYCRHNQGKKSIQADAEEDSYMDLLALLELLSFLASKEFTDVSEINIGVPVDSSIRPVADAVFTGLHYVIPMMTEALLSYPKLSSQYFELITFMVDVYPDRLSSLDDHLFMMVLQSLLFGIRHTDDHVVRYSFQAIGELAGYHLKAQIEQKIGLQRQRSSHPDIFIHLIRVIFQMAMMEEYNAVVLDACATSLYSLILMEQEQYWSLVVHICMEQTDLNIQSRLKSSFQDLMSFLKPEDISMGIANTRKYRTLFKNHFNAFVAQVRGYIQIK